MGAGLIDFYKNRLSKESKLAFYATFIVGLLVHMYKFTNTLPGHDSLYNFYSSQNMVASGRWFLSIACGLSSYFDLPWINGLLSLFWMSLTAVIIVDIFKMVNPILIILSSALLVSFPSAVEIFYFEYTADGYMLAMLLAALTVRFSVIGENSKKRFIISIVCICLCCAIYQAFVSFALVLSLCYFMSELLENANEKIEYFKWIIKQISIYIIGLALYYALWKIIMLLQGVTATGYAGIDDVAVISIPTILSAVRHSIKLLVVFFYNGIFLENGLTLYSFLNLLFIIMMVIVIVYSIKMSRLYTRIDSLVLFLLCGIAIPFSAFIWCFVSLGQVVYGVRMEYSLCILYIWGGVLLERWVKIKWKDIGAGVLVIIMLHNSIIANVYYYYMNLNYENAYAMATEITDRIHQLDDGTLVSVTIIGELNSYDENNFSDKMKQKKLGLLGNGDLLTSQQYVVLFLANVLDFELSYYSKYSKAVPMRTGKDLYGTAPVGSEWEIQFPLSDAELQAEPEKSNEVLEMPCWPAKDSVKVIDNTVVIKFSDN